MSETPDLREDADTAYRFDPHDVQWTQGKSQRVWDHISSSPRYESENYGRMLGKPLLSHLKRRGVRLSGDVLDFGCGPGFFLEYLLEHGLRCHGADTSPVAVEAARRRLAGRPPLADITLLESGRTPYGDQKFDAVFVLEVLEHILDEELPGFLSELRRITRPHGQVIVTSPNQEALGDQTQLCPDCGCRFHRGGHVQTFDASSLTKLMGNHEQDTGWVTPSDRTWVTVCGNEREVS